MKAKCYHLLFMQCAIIVLFILFQAGFFFVHYQVSDLIDTLASNSIHHVFLHSAILLPVIHFFILQCLGYALLIYFVWFLAQGSGKLLGFKPYSIYLWGLALTLLCILALLSLNAFYYPNSFYGTLWLRLLTLTGLNLALVLSLGILGGAFLLAYMNWLFWQAFIKSGLFFLLIIGLGFILSMIDNMQFRKPQFSPQAKPNIIIIGLDSLRPDFTHYLGHRPIATPQLDRFLKHSLYFTDSYSPLARTFPAWISLLTGQYPKHTGARSNLADPGFILQHATLTQRLQAEGYETMYGTDEVRFTDISTAYGFDRVFGPKSGAAEFLIGSLSDFPLSNLILKLPGARFLLPYSYGNRGVEVTYEPEDFLQLVRFNLIHHDANRPLFLGLHLCLAHWPHTYARDSQSPSAIMPERYAASVKALDAQFGLLMQTLHQFGLLQHAIVVVLSDHGVTLGLPHDRLSVPENYRGAQEKKLLMKRFKLSSAPADSLDFAHDFSMGTSYGQGTDIISLKQSKIVLAIKGYQIDLPQRALTLRSSLVDVAPTLLDLLHLPALSKADGISLVPYFSGHLSVKKIPERPLFFETGDTVSAIETDQIRVNAVVKAALPAYRFMTNTGNLVLTPSAQKSLIQNKQRAVLWGDWLLAKYPQQLALMPKQLHSKTWAMGPINLPSYYVLVHLKSGLWTIDFDTAFAKLAPLATLQQYLTQFYGDELSKSV